MSENYSSGLVPLRTDPSRVIEVKILEALTGDGSGGSGGGGGSGGALATRTGNTLWVDAVNGNDGTGTRGRLDRPYLTCSAAKAAALSGDTIFVLPGTYTDNNLFKTGVNWNLLAGAIITYTDPGSGAGYGIFDDRGSGACTCVIGGEGILKYKACNPANIAVVPGSGGAAFTGVNANVLGCVVLQNSSSNVVFRFVRIEIDGYASSNPAAVYIKNCNFCEHEVGEISEPDSSYSRETEDPEDPGIPIFITGTAIGAYWEAGECHTKLNKVVVVNYPLYGLQVTNDITANWFIECNFAQSLSAASYYNAGLPSHGANWRTWAEIKELISGAATGVNFLGGGKHYLTAMKISSTAAGSIFGFGGGDVEVWANIQKITGFGSSVGLDVTNAFSGNGWVTIQQIEDPATMSPAVRFSAGNTGTVLLQLGTAKVLNGVGISHASGTNIVEGARIDTSNTNNAANLPVSVTGSGLRLRNCVLVGPALADSVKGDAARTITAYSVFANKAKNANITVNVEAITVDTNVV